MKSATFLFDFDGELRESIGEVDPEI